MTDSHDPQMCKIFYWCLAAQLDTRQTEIIMWRYGSKKNLKQVGNMMRPKVTNEAIRQHEAKALIKLKRYIKNSDFI
jgi:DNA-directed RNA polymerase sigma subunit (sigma70/sigma32)